jgi:hypothetical protein
MQKTKLQRLFVTVITACSLIGASGAGPTTTPTTGPITDTTKPSAVDDEDSFPAWMHSNSAPMTTRYGGRRGENQDGGFITIVAPQQAGIADQASPCIYFFFTQATSRDVEIAITRDGEIDPCFETRLTGISAGLNQIDLHKSNLLLTPSATYEVVIAVVSDPQHRSRDQVCSTTVKCEPLTDAVRQQICQPDGKPSKTQAMEYLQAGCWYDGFDSICKSIEADPNNPALHAWRWKLLNQSIVHLPEVAAIDEPFVKRSGK